MKYLLHHYLENSFLNSEAKIAIKQGGQSSTFKELNELSNRFVSHYKNIGLKKGDVIGILSRVRMETIAAMIGALRSGIIYVPINIHAPGSWIKCLLENAGIQHLILDPKFVQKTISLKGLLNTITWVDSGPGPLNTAKNHFFQEIEKLSQDTSHPSILADDLAYILYTSGSTGVPKGIMITHRNAFSFVDWMGAEFEVDQSDRVFNRAPLQFDLSVFDIFTTLGCGACLYVEPLDGDFTAAQVIEFMNREKITLVYTVPSAYINWLNKGGLDKGIPTLRTLLYAGEPFPVPYLRQVMQCLPQAKISNIYGPTETNIVLCHHVTQLSQDAESVPLGYPVQDTEIYIVDEKLNRVAAGDIGEILVRGSTVFAGYFKDQAKTRERLVQSPFHDYPTLCCRTGDYGQVLSNGEIAYHGRMDDMIKTRGYRVEIGEVECALSSLHHIKEVAVIPKPHPKYTNVLCAFVLVDDPNLDSGHIVKQLEERIPSYMVPFQVVVLHEMPKTATGKIDRMQLKQRLLEQDSAKENSK